MALFKFAKKKEDGFDMSQTLGSQVASLRKQGYSDNQILQGLQSQGHGDMDISSAMNQSLGINFPNVDTGMHDFQPSQFDQYPSPPKDNFDFSQPSFAPMQQPQQMPMHTGVDEERIQEITEAIIDEKWEEFAKDVKKVIEWKERSEERLSKLEQQLVDLRLSVEALSKSIIGKISAYDQNIIDVGTEVKAMEKVFQKVLPSLTESVNKLERMTKDNKR